MVVPLARRLLPLAYSFEASTKRTDTLLVFVFVEFVLLSLLCVVLVVHLRHNRAAALRGDNAAARMIVLPAFEPLLDVLGVFDGVFGATLGVLLAVHYYDTRVSGVHLESYYSAHQYGLVLLVLFLFEKSVSVAALRRCALLALILSGYTIPYMWLVTTYGDPTKQHDYLNGLHVLRALVVLLSVYVFVWPPSRASRRAIRELTLYNIVRYLLTTVYQVLATDPSTHKASAACAFYATLACVPLSPLVLWRVLSADTGYWRGMGRATMSTQLPGLFQHTNQFMYEGGSAGGEMRLHDVIEAHRRTVIDFAHLELRQSIDADAHPASAALVSDTKASRVFHGVYRSKHRVAVKAYEPSTLTDDVVASFAREVALCSALTHPNIVAFIGLCVAPPTICLVFELCESTLEELLRSEQQAVTTAAEPARERLLVRVGYMLDAARAVAYLHSQSPPLVHRAIEPASFLVDAACNIKLANFGDVKPLSKSSSSGASRAALTDDDVWLQMPMSPSMPSHVSTDSTDDGQLDSPLTPSAHSARARVRAASNYYVAPEVLHRRAAGTAPKYDQSADVYALAVTLWDIVSSGGGNSADKLALATHRRVFERDQSSAWTRPALDPMLPQQLRDAIECAWQDDASRRPSAQMLVAMLEDVQELLAAPVALAIMDELQLCVDEPEASARSVFTGADATDALLERGVVATLVEAERMGNALMDAGLLHHAYHSRRFAHSTTERYYFAVDANIALQQLVRAAPQSAAWLVSSSTAMLTSSDSDHRRDCHDRVDRRQSQPQQRNRSASQSDSSASNDRVRDDCACERLAQRLVADAKVSVPRRRRLPRRSHRTRSCLRPQDALAHASSNDDSDGSAAGG